MKQRLCRWKCRRKTNRRDGICLECCNERDERNRRIDAGLEAYIPPEKRPGHRFYKRKTAKAERTANQQAALTKARTARIGRITEQNAPGEGCEALRQGYLCV